MTEIMPETENIEEQEAPVKKPRAKKATKEKRVKIIIHKQQGTSGNDDVDLGVNGKAYLIKRDVEVEVPESVVEVLKNAIKTVYEPDEDGNPVPREVLTHPFSIVG